MELWLDAQISPRLVKWIQDEFSINCFALRDLELRDTDDLTVFKQAKNRSGVIILSKDVDFCDLLNRFHAPPKIIWLTAGNCSNDEMKSILKRSLQNSLSILEENDLVEIKG